MICFLGFNKFQMRVFTFQCQYIYFEVSLIICMCSSVKLNDFVIYYSGIGKEPECCDGFAG